ncbi:PDZ domain-containing protein [Roseimaritima ulvae]|nr:PDZ domain-containing protein [Roseimaritima ulvae]
MAILNIDPERDRVSLVYAAPGPEGMEAIPNISPWLQGNDGGQAPRPQPRARLGVQAYKCQHGMHVQSVVVGSPATHCVNNQTGVAVSLKTNDHILAVNGVAPRNITEFQSLIRQSPRTVSLTVRDAYTQQTRVLTTNLW